MIMSEDARKARKTAQLARLACTGDPNYSAIYASQPHEIEKAAKQKAERQLARAIKNQAATAAIANAEAATSIFTSGALATSTAGSDSK